jgi:hypothetical protein
MASETETKITEPEAAEKAPAPARKTPTVAASASPKTAAKPAAKTSAKAVAKEEPVAEPVKATEDVKPEPKKAAAPEKAAAPKVAVPVVELDQAFDYQRRTMDVLTSVGTETAEAAVKTNDLLTGIVAGQIDRRVKHVETVRSLHSFKDLYSAQTSFIEAEFDAWLAGSVAMLEAGTSFFGKVSTPVETELKNISADMSERFPV